MEQTLNRYAGEGTAGGWSGNAIKIIAVTTMLIDHIGAGVLHPYVSQNYDMLAGNGSLDGFLALYTIFRTIGRIAFPIFCFLLVEGFVHTRDVRKYGFRLFLFSLISEAPFDLLFFGTWFYPFAQNVYVTLFIGLVVLAGCRYCGYDSVKKMVVVAAGCAAAWFLKSDYDMTGILMIVILYEFKSDARYQTIAGGVIAALASRVYFCAAVLAFIPIRMYNGTRGRMNLKYFFYWFYPVHLLVLYLIQLAIAG